jgi:hypothetical protein
VYAGFGTAAVKAIKLPACYSQEFDDCIMSEEPTSYPGCADIHQAYEINEDAADAAIEAMKFCSEKERYYWAGAGVLAGIFVGSLAATLMAT